MNILQILRQDLSSGKPPGKLGSQQQYRSRLRQQAETLLAHQAQGKYFDNQQKRIVTRWQRLQLKTAAEVA